MWIPQSTQSCRDGGQPAVIRGVIIYVAVLYLMANKLNEQAKFASKFSYIFIAVVLWRSQLDKWGGGGGGSIFIYSYSQTLKTINFKRN